MTLKSRFVSLGGDCQPAYHIRRMTGRQTPAFFDWLTTPIGQVVPLIESGFADVFAEERLTWNTNQHGWTAIDPRWGLVSRHNFTSREPDHVAAQIRKIRWTGRIFLEQVENDGTPVVFVRRWDGVDGTRGEADAMNVHAWLRGRLARCVFLYLQPHVECAPRAEGAFLTCYSPPTRDGKWQGDDAVYDRNFNAADHLARCFAMRDQRAA